VEYSATRWSHSLTALRKMSGFKWAKTTENHNTQQVLTNYNIVQKFIHFSNSTDSLHAKWDIKPLCVIILMMMMMMMTYCLWKPLLMFGVSSLLEFSVSLLWPSPRFCSPHSSALRLWPWLTHVCVCVCVCNLL